MLYKKRRLQYTAVSVLRDAIKSSLSIDESINRSYLTAELLGSQQTQK